MEPPNLANLVTLDDSSLLAWRHATRIALEHGPNAALQAVYDATTREVTARACEAWAAGGSAA